MHTIDAVARDATSSNRSALRDSGKIPAVFYGLGKTSTPITIDKKEFDKVFKETGESTPISLNFNKEKVNVLVHEVQVEPVRGETLHVDFLVVDLHKPIIVSVSLEFIGVAPVAKNGVGTLVKVMHEIEVQALPSDLPHSIDVDVSSLDSVDSSITVSELVLPKGVIAITKGDEIVASVAVQQEEKEESVSVDLSAIEVEKKGKKEDNQQPAE